MTITVVQAQQILDALLQAQIDDAIGALGSVSVAGHTVTFKSGDELIKQVNYWEGMVTRLKRSAARVPEHGKSVVRFGSTRGRRWDRW